MRVVISGGSNSVRKKGWTADLTRRLPSGTVVVNLSVGASTSTMGAWRVLSARALGPGDVLVWEYAVNDRNHIGKSATTAETLLRHVEHIICVARDAGARMLSVGLVSRAQAAQGADPYLLSLQRLFGHYGIPFFDAGASLPGGPLGQGDFDDANHVAVGGRVIAAVIDWLIEHLAAPDTGTVAPVEPLFRGPRRLIQLDKFQPDRVEPFRNALLDLQVRRIAGGKTGLTVTNGAGMQVEVQGLAILAERLGGVLRITTDGQTRYVATGLGEHEAKSTLLRFLSFEAAGGTLVLNPGQTIQMTWGLPRTAALALRLPGRLGQLAAQAANLVPLGPKIHRDIGFSRQIQRNPGAQGGSRISAVLAETL
jgi:hypothetical protein